MNVFSKPRVATVSSRAGRRPGRSPVAGLGRSPETLEARRLLTTVAYGTTFGTAANSATAEAVAVDSAGNSYVTGLFKGTVAFGSTSLTSTGANDAYVAKLGPTGAFVWADRIGSSTASDTDYGRSVALDSSGNVYISGFFTGTAHFGAMTATSAGGRDAFVAKLDNNGGFTWAKGFGGSGADLGQGIAVDGSGNVYQTGSFNGTANFGAASLTSQGAGDAYLLKLDSAGNTVWARRMGGTGDDSGYTVAVDSTGNPYVTGNFTSTAGFGATSLTSQGDSDGFVTKLDSAGSFTWAKGFGGPAHDDGVAIALGNGGVYLTGDFVDTASFGGVTLTSQGQDDAFVSRLDTSGNFVWTKGFGSAGFDAGFGIATDSTGNAYVTGVYQNTVAFGPATLFSQGGYDTFLLKLDPLGNLGFVRDLGSAGGEQAYGVAVQGLNITLVGIYSGDATVGSTTLPAANTAYVVRIAQTVTNHYVINDFNGDGKSDLAIFRPGTNEWFIRYTGGGGRSDQMGDPSQHDIAVPGDYNGDGVTDLAVYRPSTSTWYIRPSGGGSTIVIQMGDASQHDIPVPGDFNGDGITDLAVYRPANGFWIVRLSGNGGIRTTQMGDPAQHEVPAPADYDGDGTTDFAVFRPAYALWIIRNSSDNSGRLDQMGDPGQGDIPVTGDYNGAGRAGLAVFRRSTALFIVRPYNGASFTSQFGDPTRNDIPAGYTAGSITASGGGGSFAMTLPGSGGHAFSIAAPGGSRSASTTTATTPKTTSVQPSVGVRQAPPSLTSTWSASAGSSKRFGGFLSAG